MTLDELEAIRAQASFIETTIPLGMVMDWFHSPSTAKVAAT